MRSPIAIEDHTGASKPLAVLQQTLARVRRVDVLAERLALHIESLVPRGRARCLDIGSADTTLAEAIQERAPRTDWRCIDVHALWAEASKHEGCAVPFEQREYDIAVLCDVLHRTPDCAAKLLNAAGIVARRVLVKDHFEYGSYSRALLKLVDFVGHLSDGTGLPQRYFTREAFSRLATEQRFTITALDCGLSLYEHLPVARSMLRPDWDFIAVLRRVD